MSQPLLSIVTPTRGDFSNEWLDALCALRGDVEFVLVYPPDVPPHSITDARVRTLQCDVRGELSQRLMGLMNTQGQYVLALDDDDYAHPEIAQLTLGYFERFPNSWVLRPLIQDVSYKNPNVLAEPWQDLPDISTLSCVTDAEASRNAAAWQSTSYLIILPIAPLNKPFRMKQALVPWTGRPDMHGAHFENFNNRVWVNGHLRPVLASLSAQLARRGTLHVLPRFSLDRLLGLYAQAYYFQPGLEIGHWIRGSSQIRRVHRPASMKEKRNYFWSDSLLVRKFPQYGYFWNLFFWSLYRVVGLTKR